MKHHSLPKSSKSKFQDSKLDNERHKRPTSNSKPHQKPLIGRIFYLDLPSNKRSQTLESDIKSLGGTVEKFFSKEIRYLVSSKPEARHVQRLVQYSPVPSPDSGLSSPHPASKRDRPRGSSQGPADAVVVSRGKSLVEKVVKEQERFRMNKILANALEWGVKVLHVDDVISYIHKKKYKLSQIGTATVKTATQPDSAESPAFQKCNAGRISRPFVKVEDSSRHYRPFYLPMSNMPVCNLRSAAPCCPFLPEENVSDKPGKKPKVQGSEGEARGRRDRRRGHEGKARRKGGYCECCNVKYESLKAHLLSGQHQAFSKSEEYLVVDSVISGLTCDLMHISAKTKRVKCSMSSPVLVPGVDLKKDGEGLREVELSSSLSTDFSSETPRRIRKRCRELSRSPGEDEAEDFNAPEKSASKRGSFEWEPSSNGVLKKVLGAALSCTKKCAFSKSLEKNRMPVLVHSKPRASLSPQHNRTSQVMDVGQELETSWNQWCAGTTREARGTEVMTEGPGNVQLNCPAIPKPLLDVAGVKAFNESPPPCLMAKRAEQPFDVTDRGSASADSPSRTLQRKVRNSRRRQKIPPDSSRGLSGGREEPVTPQTSKASETRSLSASSLDLWKLFKSSDDMGDFKGFY